MGSDISRLTFDQKKHYSGVYLQQGRVLLDADWNEQLAIQHHRDQTQTKDVIGEYGVPKSSNAFKIIAAENGQVFQIEPGGIYVDGLMCEFRAGEMPMTYLKQPYYPNPNLDYLIETPVESGEEGTNEPVYELQAGNYLAYLDAWQREVNYIDDPDLLEVALNGADTTTRLQTVWQVKLLALEEGDNIQSPDFLKNKFPTLSGGLSASLDPNANPRALGNQLYRVEVHQSGDKQTATFKWSRENASIEIRIVEIKENIIVVRDPQRTKILNFAGGDWVELVTESSTFQGDVQHLIQIASVNPAAGEIVLTEAPTLSLAATTGTLKLRRWDQGQAVNPQGQSLNEASIELESGIMVQFSEGQYQTGDYWLIPSRNASASISWPLNPTGNEPAQLAPHGVQHHYCPLALLRKAEGEPTFEDYRPLFPSLTNISAEDVGFDPQGWDTEATTVQEALEELCEAETKGACTFVVPPGPGWESVFELIPEGADARICFQVGIYPLEERIELPPKGNILMVGCGFGSRIVVQNAKTAIYFDSWENVVIRDLSFEAKVADRSSPDGVLTFYQCKRVVTENIEVKCTGGASDGMFKSSSCISIYSSSDVQILNSSFLVGYLQFGINVMQPASLLIENNTFKAYHDEKLTIGDLLQDETFFDRISSFLISKPSLGPPSDIPVFPNVDEYTHIAVNVLRFQCKTHRVLKESWQALLEEHLSPETRFTNDTELREFLSSLVKKILLDETFRSGYEAFNRFYDTLNQQSTALGDTAIVVYEPLEISGRFQIMDNVIKGFQTGIYIANNLRIMDKILIKDNVIDIVRSPIIKNEYISGVRIDHPQDLILENNSILVHRLPGELNESQDGFEGLNFVNDYGIFLGGVLGKRILVRHNLVNSINGETSNSFVNGLFFRYSGSLPPNKQWAITWNILMGIVDNYDVQQESAYLADNIPNHSDNV